MATTIAELITQAEAELASATALRAAHTAEQKTLLDAVPANGSLAEDAQARFDTLTAEKRAKAEVISGLESKLTNLRADAADDEKLTRAAAVTSPAAERQSPAVVTKEERTYNRGNKFERSFFADAVAAQFGNDFSARERIERHQREAIVEGEMSQRAGTTTGFVGLIPPVYLPDEYALLPRAGRPTANIVRHLPLPPSGMSIIIPRGTTGVTEAVQATENSAVSNTDQVNANVTVPVVTIAGQQDVSRQSLERGIGVDEILFADLYGAYNVALDAQVIFGTGSSGQMLGITATAGINQATAFGAAATTTTFYSKAAGQLSAIETTRYLAPDIAIMHPRRWNWLLSQVDTQGRPLVVPNLNGPYNSIALAETPIDTPASVPVGWIFGLPVITDASIPTNLGVGALEDEVIFARKEDLYLWENGDGAPFQLRFEQTTGGSLTTKIVAYNYAAFTAGRYPTAVGIVGGNAGTSGFGLTTPVF